MKKMIIASGVAALALASGVAIAQSDRGQAVTRAEATQRAAERFARMDVNADGRFDTADRAARTKARRDAAFTALDADGNGQISRAEFDARNGLRGVRGAHGKRHGGRGPDRHGGFMRDGDRAGGATLTRADFEARALARFDRVDADSDGRITRAERIAARAARRTARQAQ